MREEERRTARTRRELKNDLVCKTPDGRRTSESGGIGIYEGTLTLFLAKWRGRRRI